MKKTQSLSSIKGKIKDGSTRAYIALTRPIRDEAGIGWDVIIGTVIVVVIAAFITLPGLQDFGDDVMDKINSWWTTISEELFPTS